MQFCCAMQIACCSEEEPILLSCRDETSEAPRCVRGGSDRLCRSHRLELWEAS